MQLSTYSGGVFMVIYFALYMYYLYRGFVLLRSRPYNSFRVGNVLVRLQVRRHPLCSNSLPVTLHARAPRPSFDPKTPHVVHAETLHAGLCHAWQLV
jgi:hypothetical protein